MLIRTEQPDGSSTATLDGVGVVSSATADLVGCDADTTVVRRDERGRIWDVGRSDGDPSTNQRRVVIARDQVCVGCGAPATRCQLHHIRWRRHQGKAVVDNLVLVCWSCHHGIHHLDWRITGDALTGFAINRHTDARDPVHGAQPSRHTH
ncbi:MAG: hypothetical protein GEU74_14695 [Nitriliruptorales bacterium]|nr:hypothetical protein [Nitriliruptorales bacterium]